MNFVENIKQKYKSLPLPIKASFWFMVCSLATKSVSVISTMILTRLMTTKQYGLVTLYNSWFEIVAVVASLNLSVGVFNVGMTKYENSRAKWMATLCFLSLGATIIFSIVFLSSYSFFYRIIQLPESLVVFMLVSIFPSTVYSIWLAAQRYALNYKKMVKVTMIYSIAILIIGTIAVFFSSNKGEAKVISNATVTIVIGSVLFYQILMGAKEKFSSEYALFALKYNVQMMPAFISAFILNQMDRIMIDNMCGRSQQGVYSFAYNAAIMISIVGTSLSAVFNPWFMQRIKGKKFDNIPYISNATALLFFLAIVGFSMIAPEIVLVLGTKEYSEAVYIIPAVAGSTFFALIYTLYCPILQYNLKTKSLSFITVFTAVLNFVLNYICIKEWGYIAAGYTTFVCYLLYGWGTAFFAVKTAREKEYGNNIFDHKFLLLLSFLLLILSVSVNYLYDHTFIRFIIVAILIMGLVFFRNKLVKVIKEIRT